MNRHPSRTPAPFITSWNLTRRCPLRCPHCYLDSTELTGPDTPGTLNTQAALAVVDEIAELSPGGMLVLTGGEPLLRDDIFDISSRASGRGLTVAVGTGGTMLDGETVRRLKGSGVSGAGVSLDSASPAFHDRFRGLDGAWDSAVKGMGELREGGLDFQVQFTVTGENRGEMAGVMELARDKGARAVNFFFLVCTGRGQESTALTPAEYGEVLGRIVDTGGDFDGMMVRARCAPHVLMVAGERAADGSGGAGPGAFATSGCIAGRGYLRVTPEGRVTPCPYIPPREGSPRLGPETLRDIWENDPSFLALRNPVLKGRCGGCSYADVCGGCRARGLAEGEDLMTEDPWCEYDGGEKKTASERKAGEAGPVWTAEAEARLARAPAFVRGLVKRGAEAYARSKGLEEITPEVLERLRPGKRGGR